MPLIDYDELRRRVSMEQVLDLLGFEPTSRRGEQYRGACPVHATDAAFRAEDGCFSVHLGRGVFRCFRCGAQGNQLELWQLVHDQRLYEAALELSQRAGIEAPWL